MRKSVRVKYIAAEIHALLFIAMWGLYAGLSQPLLDGPSAVPFLILFVVDLPLSFVAFGVMFTSAAMGPVAEVLWGILGTAWWFAIGYVIDKRIENYRRNRAADPELFPATIPAIPATVYSPRKEVLIAVVVVAVLVAGSIGWQWNGKKRHFEAGEIHSFSFNPDGRSILLVRAQGDTSAIETVDLSSGNSAPLGKKLPCLAMQPAFSPDAKKIAFACEAKLTGLSKIMVMDANGDGLHPLFSANSSEYDFAPNFTSAGNEIVFGRSPSYVKQSDTGGRSPQLWDIYSAALDGGGVHRLTENHFEDCQVSFSADRRKFVIPTDLGSGARLSLYSLEDPAKAPTKIVPNVTNGSAAPVIDDVGLAADGQSIYFMAASDGAKGFDYDVYRLNIASNAIEKFTRANGYATALAVSEDGKTAVFLRWTSRWGSLPNLSRLYVLSMATKRIRPLNVTGQR